MGQIDELKQVTMSAIVTNLQQPNRFLKKLLYPTEVLLDTEDVRIETRTNTRQMAPFVRKNGQALTVKGFGDSGWSVGAPNIRIKKPLTPDQRLYNRPLGDTNLFIPTPGVAENSILTQITDDLSLMEDMIVESEEYLISRSLQGQIAYAQADEEVFTITFPRSSANNITMSVMLDDATPANIRYLIFLMNLRKQAADAGEPAPTDTIVGDEVAYKLMDLAEAGVIKMFNPNNNPNVVTDVNFTAFVNSFSDDGVLFLGIIGGINHWWYPRKTSLKGTSVDLIRGKYGEFISRSPACRRKMYYALIPDITALRGRKAKAKRFSKSWEEQDPSAYMALVASRPLPVPERVNSSFSVKMISG